MSGVGVCEGFTAIGVAIRALARSSPIELSFGLFQIRTRPNSEANLARIIRLAKFSLSASTLSLNRDYVDDVFAGFIVSTDLALSVPPKRQLRA